MTDHQQYQFMTAQAKASTQMLDILRTIQAQLIRTNTMLDEIQKHMISQKENASG